MTVDIFYELYCTLSDIKARHEGDGGLYDVEFIFDEKTKIKMMRFAPVTIDDLSHFDGWTKDKLNKYGQEYVDDIAECLRKCKITSPFESLPINKRLNAFCKSRDVYHIIDQTIAENSKESESKEEKEMKDVRAVKTKKMILNKRYYDVILEIKKKYNLEQYVKDQINSMNYNFPQIRKNVEEFFCNTEFYGKLNIIEATGFIKVEKRKDDEFIVDTLPKLLNKYLPNDICNVLISYVEIQP